MPQVYREYADIVSSHWPEGAVLAFPLLARVLFCRGEMRHHRSQHIHLSRSPAMTPQRLRQVATAMMLTSAALIAFGVIPSVRADTFNLASAGDAIPVFWGIVLIDLFLAVAAFAASRFDPSQAQPRSLSVAAGVVSVLLGLLLIDAAAAYAGHGPGMRGAVVALWACVGLGLAAGAFMIVSTFRRSHGRPEAA